MIHFQGGQVYATLRATEVKPKLDKFLIKKLQLNQDSVLTSEYRKWLVGEKKSHPAFNYKMQVGYCENEASIIPEGERRKRPAMFFGNMGDHYNDNTKWVVQATGYIPLKIIVLDKSEINGKSLLAWIDEILPEFFFLHNFGTRQTKGYGSFGIVGRVFQPENIAYFTTLKENVFKDIELLYKAIRSGHHDVNRNRMTDYYFKSILFKYFNDKGTKWDKRFVKERLIHSDRSIRDNELGQKVRWCNSGQSFDSSVNGDHVLARDMLGLSVSQKWQSYRGTEITKEHIPDPKGSLKIERFRSPLLFKPVLLGNEWRVYIIPDKIPEEMHKQKFKLEATKFSKSDSISTPSTTKFTLKLFLDWLLGKDAAGNYVDISGLAGTYSRHPKTKRILAIIDELRKNY